MSESSDKRGPEPWAWLAFGVAAAYMAMLVYLGSRPGGLGPVKVWGVGPPLLGFCAFGVALFGLVWSALRRPALQRRRLWALLAAGSVCALAPFPMPYPSSHAERPSLLEFELPVEGAWRVRFGGERFFDNPLVVLPDRCTALHLVREEEGERLVDGGSAARAEDHLGFGSAIAAPVAGRVVRASDGLPDRAPAERAEDPFPGNHLVLEVAEGQYLFLTGLQQGSLQVGEGEAVERGQALARVGCSGASRFTAEPHLAIHLQDTPEPHWGEGIPWSLRRYRSNGARIDRGVPRGGLEPSGQAVGELLERAP